MQSVVEKAKTKLASILASEGDPDGTRNSAEYLLLLIEEQQYETRCAEETQNRYKEKRRVAEANAPSLHPHCITEFERKQEVI